MDRVAEGFGEMVGKKAALKEVVLQLETYAREHDYAGFCKFDGLNSPLLESVFGKSALTRLLVTQAVNRVPLPLRSTFGVKKYRNPKGIANFIRGYAGMKKAVRGGAALPVDLDSSIVGLSDWLLKNDSRSRGQYAGQGRAWGYPFPWQSPGFYAPRHSPNCIVSTFCGEALLAAFHATGKEEYLQAAHETSLYLTRTLPTLESTPDLLCLGYVDSELSWKVININSVVAGFLAKLSVAERNSELLDQSRRLINWVLQSCGPGEVFWNYTFPKSQSGIGPDNYHTGGILDGILDYMEASGDFSRREEYLRCLEFYDEKFFDDEGAPSWRVHRPYPMDVHGAAQGILTFAKAATIDEKYLKRARLISTWATENLRDPETGRFYYQKHRLFIWKVDLMRWNNSWMMWALSELLARSV